MAGNPAKRVRINYALAATLLTTGLHYDEIAPQVGAKNGQSVRLGLLKRGVTLTKVRQLPCAIERTDAVILRVATAAGQIVRDRLAKDLDATTAKLAETKVRKGLKHIRERVEVLEPLTRTASKLFGWEGSAETPVTMLFLEQDQPIDVTSTVEHTPIGSVPDSKPDVS